MFAELSKQVMETTPPRPCLNQLHNPHLSVHPWSFCILISFHPSVFPLELLCIKMSFQEKEKAKCQREGGIRKDKVNIFVMDEEQKQFTVEVAEALLLARVRGKQAADYSEAAKILVKKHRWPMALCSSHLAGKTACAFCLGS